MSKVVLRNRIKIEKKDNIFEVEINEKGAFKSLRKLTPNEIADQRYFALEGQVVESKEDYVKAGYVDENATKRISALNVSNKAITEPKETK